MKTKTKRNIKALRKGKSLSWNIMSICLNEDNHGNFELNDANLVGYFPFYGFTKLRDLLSFLGSAEIITGT